MHFLREISTRLSKSQRSCSYAKTLIKNSRLRDRNDETAAPSSDDAHLLDDLVLEIPWQQQHVIGSSLGDGIGCQDRNAVTRQITALLEDIAIDCEFDNIRSDAAIVQQRIALGGRAIGGDGGATLLQGNEKRQQLSLGVRDALGERRIGCDEVKAGVALLVGKALDLDAYRPRPVFSPHE